MGVGNPYANRKQEHKQHLFPNVSETRFRNTKEKPIAENYDTIQLYIHHDTVLFFDDNWTVTSHRCEIKEDDMFSKLATVQPVPWKIRLEMIIRMQNEILIGIMKLLF